MSATNAFEASIIALIFNATAIADLAQDDGSAPATNLYVSLHTADPGETGTQSSSEAAYTGYARIAVARTSGGWTCSGSQASNAAQITFGQCTASPADMTHVGVGTGSSGAGALLCSLQLTSPVVMAIGATPIFSTGQLVFKAD